MSTLDLSKFGLHGAEQLSRAEMKGVVGGAFYRCSCQGASGDAQNFLISSESEGSAVVACDQANGHGSGACIAEAY